MVASWNVPISAERSVTVDPITLPDAVALVPVLLPPSVKVTGPKLVV